ncbi:MAG: type II toxin-antitoxin system RelE/ParE family toxin [Clostridia bacterium]|nr:type II toxin-antitoxin system RelE/ParE family toxin [Clostridia bacterium]
MESKRYKLRFLPLFEEDLIQIVDYITDQLQNPQAADALVDAVQRAIQERTTCAEAFEPYHSAKERQYPYYRIYVRNYTIYYVVIGDVMEVRRILYNKRDLRKSL